MEGFWPEVLLQRQAGYDYEPSGDLIHAVSVRGELGNSADSSARATTAERNRRFHHDNNGDGRAPAPPSSHVSKVYYPQIDALGAGPGHSTLRPSSWSKLRSGRTFFWRAKRGTPVFLVNARLSERPRGMLLDSFRPYRLAGVGVQMRLSQARELGCRPDAIRRWKFSYVQRLEERWLLNVPALLNRC